MTAFDKWFKEQFGGLPVVGRQLTDMYEEQAATQRLADILEDKLNANNMQIARYNAAKMVWDNPKKGGGK